MSIIREYNRRDFLVTTGGALAGFAAAQAFGAEVVSKQYGLVVGHHEGGKAGMAVLAGGGNAVDAIVCAALVAGVVAVPMCGIGGYGGHMAIGIASPSPDRGGERVGCIDFNSEAPAAARPDMFPLDDKGNVKGKVNEHGWLAAGVPGTLAGLQLALDRFGSRSFAQLVDPAIRYARDGFRMNWSPGVSATALSRDAGSRKLFWHNGKPLERGATYRNPDLAAMLEKLAEQGSVSDFYRGDIARQIAAAFKKNGGLVTAEDMAAYKPIESPPLTLDWNDHTIATAPLTAGGLTILQAIAELKSLGTDWDRLAKDSPKRTQMWIEALRIAWGDRLRLFGDPRFV
ncbi:MAG TPA: gamma-glutamyltransferase, partial [Lacipirellulaceae bacterium]|nr:gamma-glutamyltransferase [Lacipirellulaceae bacterium]